MADAEGPKPQSTGEFMLTWIFLLWLVATVINRVPIMIEERTGVDIFDVRGSYARMTEFSDDTQLGITVIADRQTDVLDAAGFGALSGLVPEDSEGVLTGGPEYVNTVRWWEVAFEGAADGWVPESALTIRAAHIMSITFIILIALSVSVVLIFLTLLIYTTIRLNQIRAAESQRFKELAQSAEAIQPAVNPRWQQVMAYIESDNPNDWRHAIMDADVMLDEMVGRMGYRGESLGEKLKGIERSDFTTIDEAWEAHKIRNQIAHGGSDFILTQREARRAIDLYRKVFEEFYYI